MSAHPLEAASRLNITSPRIFCFGILFFTRHTIHSFLEFTDAEPCFVKTADEALKKGFDNDCHILSWGKRGEAEAAKLSSRSGVAVWQIEDGFLRSPGLGSDFYVPLSLVIDQRGIYYDPGRESDLEYLLQHHSFTDTERKQGKEFREQLLQQAVSKYNLGDTLKSIDSGAASRLILIPGQVEDDASIRKGTLDITSNSELIRVVRENNPDAFIIYKPHPDVVSGNRIGQVSESITRQYCDQVLNDRKITDCLKLADEVHTMTSLTGFEGLLYGCKVHCYGLPFYAGWGLTHDRHSLARRKAQRTLDELVYATFFLYPLYYDWDRKQHGNAETALKQLGRQIRQSQHRAATPRLFRQLRKGRNILVGAIRALRLALGSDH